MPFMDRMGWVTLILTALMVVISLVFGNPAGEEKALRWDREDFRTEAGFMAGSVLVMGMIAALYAVYW